MEDALAQRFRIIDHFSGDSLNPCFNGRCTRTNLPLPLHYQSQEVLILVLMEDALAPFLASCQQENSVEVLILVLMEDALARKLAYQMH